MAGHEAVPGVAGGPLCLAKSAQTAYLRMQELTTA